MQVRSPLTHPRPLQHLRSYVSDSSSSLSVAVAGVIVSLVSADQEGHRIIILC